MEANSDLVHSDRPDVVVADKAAAVELDAGLVADGRHHILHRDRPEEAALDAGAGRIRMTIGTSLRATASAPSRSRASFKSRERRIDFA